MAVKRRKDWGDQFPSDQDDVAPKDPLAGMAEVAGGPRQGHGANRDVPDDIKGAPDAQIQPKDGGIRNAFTGIIVKRLKQNEYKVLRQDGRTGTAYTRGDDVQFDELTFGEHVTMIADQFSAKWLITGTHRHIELSTITVTNSAALKPTNKETVIPFDLVLDQTGELVEPEWDGRHIAFGVTVQKDQECVYDLEYSVTVRCVNPRQISDIVTIQVLEQCIISIKEYKHFLPAHGLIFDRSVGFMVGIDPSSQTPCNALITLGVSAANYGISTDDNKNVIWSDSPTYGNSVKVGVNVPQGWIKIHSSGIPYIWLGHGKRPLKLKFPNNDPQLGSHMYVSGINKTPFDNAGGYGFCVQTEWTKPGGDGVIGLYICDPAYCSHTKYLEWQLDKGLVLSGPGVKPYTTNEPVSCDGTSRNTWSCPQ